jgi:hypothetical protein
MLINDYNGHSYTSGRAGLGLRCQAWHRRASCQLVGVRIIHRRLSQSRSELKLLMHGSVNGYRKAGIKRPAQSQQSQTPPQK